MKQRIAVLVVLLSAFVMGMPAFANLLLNPDFESGPGGGGSPDNWWVYNDCGQEAWAARNGEQGVAFRSWAEEGWGGCGQDVGAAPDEGDVVSFSIWAYAEGAYTSLNQEAWIQIKLFTNEGTSEVGVFQQSVYDSLVAQAESWNEYRVVITNTLAGIDKVQVAFGGGGFCNGDGSRSVLWDDASLLITEGGSAQNLLLSPGFEDDANWTLGGEMGYEPWAMRSDVRGIAMYGWRDGGYAYQDVALAGRSGYTFSIYGFKDASFDLSTLTTELKLEFFDDDGTGLTRIGEAVTVVQSATEAWAQYSVSGVSPEDTDVVRVTLAFGGTASDNSFKWDDAVLVAEDAPETGLIVRSSVDSNRRLDLQWAGETSRYYQVWASDVLDGEWPMIRGLKLGADADQVWQEDIASLEYTSLYYRVVARLVEYPQDLDDDGLDDVAELRSGNSDPLDADSDDDGIDDGEDPRPANPNEAPQIIQISLGSTANNHNDGSVFLVINATDNDGDTIAYRYAANGGTSSVWQTTGQFIWAPPANAVGTQTMVVDARDDWDAQVSDLSSIYLFQTPPRP